MLTGVVAGRGVETGGGAGWAAGSGCGLAAAGGAFRGVVPRRLVWATDVLKSVNKRINESAPRAVFIQNSLFFERIIEELWVRGQIRNWRCLWFSSAN